MKTDIQVFERKLPFPMTSDQESAVQAVARKLRIKFVHRRACENLCFFTISSRVKGGWVDRKELLLNAITESNLGDNRGVFSGAPWFYADFICEKVSMDNFREVIRRKQSKLHLKICELDSPIVNHVCCEHIQNRYAYIDLFFEIDGRLRIKTSCETFQERRLIVSYFSGFIADHFSKQVTDFQVKLSERSFEGIGVSE
jgi:hypothetical protein